MASKFWHDRFSFPWSSAKRLEIARISASKLILVMSENRGVRRSTVLLYWNRRRIA